MPNTGCRILEVHMEGSNSLCKTESHTALAGQGPRPREYVTTCRRAESCGPTLLGPRIGPPSSSSSSHHAPRHCRQIGLRTYVSLLSSPVSSLLSRAIPTLGHPRTRRPSATRSPNFAHRAPRCATRGHLITPAPPSFWPSLHFGLLITPAPRGARRAVISSPLRTYVVPATLALRTYVPVKTNERRTYVRMRFIILRTYVRMR